MKAAQLVWCALTALMLLLAAALACIPTGDTNFRNAVALIFLFAGIIGFAALTVMLINDRKAD